ncbi:tRNA (guanosine(46)-N7)-methyltransferase TrmB [Trueperella sp. LYQ143]|uniref:tRNA (guanosine(46)-N7)-methyltransferase TrmB n=1 Tax=Trueperella sp. LYQ143 TaxID=3391059 RepID=UPI003982F5C2
MSSENQDQAQVRHSTSSVGVSADAVKAASEDALPVVDCADDSQVTSDSGSGCENDSHVISAADGESITGRNIHYGRIVSFSRRGSRLGDKYRDLMEQYREQFVIDYPAGAAVAAIAPDAQIDLSAQFGTQAPMIIEVGPGSGEQLISAAQQHPEWNFLGLEAWGPGVARCVSAIVRAGVSNVRMMELDAAQGLPVLFGAHQRALRPQVAQVWTFFPDPWRKKRHHKRRIVNPEFARTVHHVLAEGGSWRLATDWSNYAWHMRDVVEEAPGFVNPYADQNPDPADEGRYRGGFAPRWDGRVMTRFEQRGLEAGRRIFDIHVVAQHVSDGE